jgi:hypothetical protein
MSPTSQHYLISFATGTAVVALSVAIETFSRPLADFQPQVFLWSLGGGIALFARDWIRNNSGAFLEGTPPGQLAKIMPQIIDAPAPQTPPS